MHGIAWARWTMLLVTVALLAVSVSAVADEAVPVAPAPAADKAWAGGWNSGVEEGQPRDEVSGETMVVAAYGVLWLILILFVLRAQAQVAALRRESAELGALVEARLPHGGDVASSARPTADTSN